MFIANIWFHTPCGARLQGEDTLLCHHTSYNSHVFLHTLLQEEEYVLRFATVRKLHVCHRRHL